MENHPSDRRKVTEALIKGREFANQLLQLVSKTSGDEEEAGSIVPLAEDLARKILRSFATTLALLNDACPSGGGEVSTMKVSDSSSPKHEILEEKCSINQHRRYKRRRTSIATWEKDSSTLIDDGYAWRKYGQKQVLNSNCLRNYFRCTYKFDQACQATKQVQRIQEDPPLYRTTYYGYHTCKNLQNPDEIILNCTSPQYSSMLLNFSNSFPSKQDYVYCSSSSSTTKVEFEEAIPDYHVINNLSSNF